MYTKEVKMFVLQQILEKKNILFGQFSDRLNKVQKQDAWKEVFESCRCLNAFPGKEYIYLLAGYLLSEPEEEHHGEFKYKCT